MKYLTYFNFGNPVMVASMARTRRRPYQFSTDIDMQEFMKAMIGR